MPPERSVKEIFNDAAELEGEERAAFLGRACGGDAALRARVEFLLSVRAGGGEFMTSPTASGDLGDSPLREGPGTAIGPYVLREQIGEGGFGVVFMAEQEQPIRRRVALKVIKLGMDTRAVIARFDAERRALAMMDHPNIARVLDAGATESGRPYFVMELVRGEPITTFCDRNSLTLEERLRLFEQVCQAVQHAHQKGIIHRDIKPGNILVTTTERGPVPKVIDFGIAKATLARLTEKTLFTEHRQLLGTPEYMSPEQADSTASDIDTRTDVYSLGVLLYELLTGALPYDAKRLRSAAFGEIQRIIREEEPAKPSTRLSTLEALPSVAACRRTDPARLGALIRGDLDWIVMKAMEKDRARRYATAHGLAMDIVRHLAGEAVLAAPPTRAYRMRKFIRRHRRSVIALGLVAAVLLIGAAGTTSGLVWALRERGLAEAARDAAEDQQKLAEQRLGETEQVAEFQARMLRDLDIEAMGRGIEGQFREQVGIALEREHVGQWPDRRARTPEEVASGLSAFDGSLRGVQAVDIARRVVDNHVLRPAAEAIEEQFADQPLVRAGLRQAIGVIYREIGLYDAAEPHLRAALETRKREAPEDKDRLMISLEELGSLLYLTGDYDEAEPLLRATLAMTEERYGREHSEVASCMNNLAVLLKDKGDYAAAEPLYAESLAMYRRTLGNEHALVATAVHNLAEMESVKGDQAKAETLYREAAALWRTVHGPESAELASCLNNLGRVLRDRAEYDAADQVLREALAMRRRVLGDRHPDVAGSLYNLGTLHRRTGDYAAAEPLLREALALWRETLGDQHRNVSIAMGSLASTLGALGDHAGAERMLREALSLTREAMGDAHPDTASALNDLAGQLAVQGDPRGAEPLLREAVEIARNALGDEHPQVAQFMNSLGGVLRENGDLEGAEPLLRGSVAIRRRTLGSDHPYLASSLVQLALLLVDRGDYAEAEAAYREALAIYEGKFPAGNSRAATARGGLGGVLVRLAADPALSAPEQSARRSEAKGHLLAAYETLSPLPAEQRSAGRVRESLVDLYDGWHAAEPGLGHDAEAARWRAVAEGQPQSPDLPR